jgi:hypothetical protein
MGDMNVPDEVQRVLDKYDLEVGGKATSYSDFQCNYALAYDTRDAGAWMLVTFYHPDARAKLLYNSSIFNYYTHIKHFTLDDLINDYYTDVYWLRDISDDKMYGSQEGR